MKTHEWVARWRNERRETREKFDWRHDATTRPLPACRLRPVRDAHSRYPLDAIHREDWAGTLPAKFFAPHVILRVDSHAGVHVEALRFRRGFRFHMLDRRRAIGRPDVREFTSVKRDLRARIYCPDRGRFVGFILASRHVPFSLEPGERPIFRSHRDREELVVGGRERLVKSKSTLRPHENAGL
jgi:hypothetical protein